MYVFTLGGMPQEELLETQAGKKKSLKHQTLSVCYVLCMCHEICIGLYFVGKYRPTMLILLYHRINPDSLFQNCFALTQILYFRIILYPGKDSRYSTTTYADSEVFFNLICGRHDI